MRIVPITLKEANAFVAQHHRHHGLTVGHKFSIGLKDEAEDLIGVAIADRPVSRVLDDGQTLEINRLCTMVPGMLAVSSMARVSVLPEIWDMGR